MDLILRGGVDWVSFVERFGRTNLEQRMIEAKIDPNKVFKLSKTWILSSEVSPSDVVERVTKIIEAFEDALKKDKDININIIIDHEFEGNSTKTRIEEWEEPQTYRMYQRIDLKEMIKSTRTSSVAPEYSVHPAKLSDVKQGTPSNDNGKTTDHVYIDLTTRHKVIPALRRTATSYFQKAKEYRNRFGLIEKIMVKGVGNTVSSEDVDREKIKVLQKRIEELRRKEVIGSPGAFSEPFPVITNQYSSRGLELWPQDFLEERIKRWKNVFFGWIFDWYTDTRDDYDRRLKENGWLNSGPAGGDAADLSRSGNDVRVNATRLFEDEVLIPVVKDVMGILDRDFDFLELSLAKEEIMDLVFEALEAEEPGVENTIVARGMWAKNVLKLHPPPNLISFYNTYLELRGRTLESHPPPKWIKDFGKGDDLPSMKTVLELFEGYLHARLSKSIDKKVDEIIKDDTMAKFLAQQLDGRILAELTDGGVILTDEENRRLIAYSDASTDPSYELLIRLTTFSDERLIREMQEVDIEKEKLELFPGRGEKAREFSSDVRALNLRFYNRPFSRKFGQEGDSEPFLFWMNRMRVTLPSGFAGAISPNERADINEYAVQNARFELIRALEKVSDVKEIDTNIEIRKGTQSLIILRPQVPVWPAKTETATFDLKLNWIRHPDELPGGEKTIRSFSVLSPQDNEGREFELGEWPEAGDYVVIVTALDKNENEVGLGSSVKFSVKRLARCARCGNEFDFGRHEVTPEGFSIDCKWKTKLIIQEEIPRESLIDWLTRRMNPNNPDMTKENMETIFRRTSYKKRINKASKNARTEKQVMFLLPLKAKMDDFETKMIAAKEKERLRLAPTTRTILDRSRVDSIMGDDDFSFDTATLQELKDELQNRWGIDASDLDVYEGREQKLSDAAWEYRGSHSVNNPFPTALEIVGDRNVEIECDIVLKGVCKDYEILYSFLFANEDETQLFNDANINIIYGSVRIENEHELNELSREFEDKAKKLKERVIAERGAESDWTFRQDYEDVVRLIKKFNGMSFGEAYTGMR